MIHINSPQKKSDLVFFKDIKKNLIHSDQLALSEKADALFKTKISQTFFKKINNENLNDPLAMQVYPSSDELIDDKRFTDDPVGDDKAMAVPGLIHKYENRVLLITTANCEIHCRYCFRRNFNYQNSVSKDALLIKAIEYIQSKPLITEVILSGGDPLTLNNQSIFKICDALLNIPHLKTLRIHSRFPIVNTKRFDNDFVQYFKNYALNKVFVCHVNHANELDNATFDNFNLLKQTGFYLLNQSVLLKGVNDSSETLAELSFKLFDQGVLPYYLHLLDYVKGASHFEVNNKTSKNIYLELPKLLPGYLVPKMVKEISGELSKTYFNLLDD